MVQEYQREKQEYIEKLESIVADANAILALNAAGVVTEDVRRELASLRDRALTLLPKLRKGEFEIAVVGLEKAGKSTFSNALLNMAVLPSA